MKRIALISDNHSYYGEDLLKYVKDVDEIWHAGDFGSMESIKPLMELKPFKGVYGNIDSGQLRIDFPLNLSWECEGVSVFMTHIGGYPGRYKSKVKDILVKQKPQLYICGHSHICKVMYDKELDLLHMNPGAYGFHGWHQVRTIIRFNCNYGNIENAEVVELGYRGKRRKI